MEGDCCRSELSLWTEASGTDCNDNTVDCSSVNLPMPDESMMSCYSVDLMLHSISFTNDELSGYLYAAEISVFQTDQVLVDSSCIVFCDETCSTALSRKTADCSYPCLFGMFAG